MKKILAVLLSLCLLLAAVPMSAIAAAPVDTDIVLSAEGAPETVYPGQTFSVNIKISENTGVYTWRADLGFDSDVFSMESCNSTADFADEDAVPRFSYKETEGNIRILWDAVGSNNFTGNGVIATVTFKVNDVAASGNYNFDLTMLDAARKTDAKPFAEAINISATDCATKIEQIAVTGIEVLNHNAKTEYYIGDAYNMTEATVKVTKNYGDPVTITSGYSVALDSSKEGSSAIIITYEGATAEIPVTIKKPTVELSSDSEYIIAGNDLTLSATTDPVGKTLTWDSTNKDVATVDQNGKVTAIAKGQTTITASFEYNGTTYKDECAVTVDSRVVEKIEIDDETLNAKTEYFIGDELEITSISIKVTYNDGDVETKTDGYDTDYDFSSAGEKTVTITYGDKSDTFTVNVTKPSIEISTDSDAFVSENEYDFTVSAIPENQTINWDSTNKDVATVVNGKVTTIAAGETTIKASFTYKGITYTDEYTITVIERAVEQIEINDETLDAKTEYFIGDTLEITSISIKVTYNDGDVETKTDGYDTNYDFSSAGEKTVTITYGDKSDTFTVNVTKPSITLSDSEKVVILDKTYQINITELIPDDVTVSWKSDDEDVATVVNGLVTAKAEGEATITASFTYNGTTYSAECVVTVKMLLGDINDDGLVNTTDLAQLKLYLVGATTFTDKQLAVADVSQSDGVNTTDLALMKLYLAGVFNDFEANNK